MKPICVPCRRFFKPKKNGVFFIEGMPVMNGAKPGSMEAEKWKPYKLWSGDLWECPDCGAVIISGTGKDRIAEHYQEDFAEKIEKYGVEIQVNDC